MLLTDVHIYDNFVILRFEENEKSINLTMNIKGMKTDNDFMQMITCLGSLPKDRMVNQFHVLHTN